jgi:hypothetical protein
MCAPDADKNVSRGRPRHRAAVFAHNGTRKCPIIVLGRGACRSRCFLCGHLRFDETHCRIRLPLSAPVAASVGQRNIVDRSVVRASTRYRGIGTALLRMSDRPGPGTANL